MKYCRNFCLKIVVKSSLSTWVLTKTFFFSLLTWRWWIMRFYGQEMKFEIVWGCFWNLQTHWTRNAVQFWKNWILPPEPSFLVVFTYSEPYTGRALSCDGHFRSPITSRAVRKASKTSWEMPEIIMNHILEPKSNRNSPSEFASQWKWRIVEISASE